MKKKYLTMGALALALAVAIGYGIKSSVNSQTHLSELAKANIEALAGAEQGTSTGNACYKGDWSSSNPLAVTCGNPCTMDYRGGETDTCP
jgi:hypothetical protein